MEKPCPLETWLDRHGESVTDFAERAGLAFSTCYDIIGGKRRSYRVDTVSRIETATAGEVTLRMLIDWITSLERADL